MTQYSDAAMLTGDYEHLALQLREGRAAADKKLNWSEAACDNKAEEAAQEVAKHILAFSQSLDHEKEQMEILSYSVLGQLKVMAIIPGEEGDLLRIDGISRQGGKHVSVIIHASQLALTFDRVPAKKKGAEKSDGSKIGYVIFDDLKDRRKARYKKASAAKRAAARKKKAPTMAQLKEAAKKAGPAKASPKKPPAKTSRKKADPKTSGKKT